MTPAGSTINRITLHRVRLPLRQAYVSSMYVMREVYRTLVEVETSDGFLGVGEAPGSEEVWFLLERLSRSVLGTSPLERHRLQRTFAPSVFHNRSGRNGWAAVAGLELAYWDWAGRRFGVPVHELIDESSREWIDVACPLPAIILDADDLPSSAAGYLGRPESIDAVVQYAIEQRDRHGYRCFKYKSAGLDAGFDLRMMRALRDALGAGAALRWDPNAAYPASEATVLCGRMEALGLEFHEDPTSGVPGMAALRERLRTPLATNMCVVQFDQLAGAVRQRPADVLLADPYMWGGIENFLSLAAVGAAYGFDVAIHSLFETGVGTAANLHLAAALGQIHHANDCGLNVLAADVVTPALEIVDGRIRVPAGPGWGIGLDRAALAARTVARADIENGAAA